MRQWRGFWIHGMVSSGRAPAALDRQKLKFWASVRGTLKTWLGTEWLGRLLDFLELGAPFCASGHHKPNLATRLDQTPRSPGNVVTTPSSTSGFQHLNPSWSVESVLVLPVFATSQSPRALSPGAKVVPKQVVHLLGFFSVWPCHMVVGSQFPNQGLNPGPQQ